MANTNVEYDVPFEQEYYSELNTGENDELGCRTCGGVFSAESLDDEVPSCTKCGRKICPYCAESDQREDDGQDHPEEEMCEYCRKGRLSLNDLAKAFISLAEKKGLSVRELYTKAMK